METMEQNELKQCPFCNGKAVLYFTTPDGMHTTNFMGRIWGMEADHYLCTCKKCGVRTKVYASKARCISAWNRRSGSEGN